MYGLFDIAIQSDIHLPELPYTGSGDVVFQLQAGAKSMEPPARLDWFHHWKTSDGLVCFSGARHGQDYVLRFPDLVDFVISGSADRVLYYLKTDVQAQTLRHLLLDQLLPRMLSQHGRLIVHASAVVLPTGKTIAFLGGSGRGKSTLACSFHANGAQLITDDCLLLEEVHGDLTAIPSYLSLRLCEDSTAAIFNGRYTDHALEPYSNKKRLAVHSTEPPQAGGRINLDAIFLLYDPAAGSPTDPITIEPVCGADELMTLLNQMFIIDVTDRDLIATQFRNKAHVLSTNVPVFGVDFPRRYPLLGAVRTSIADVLE